MKPLLNTKYILVLSLAGFVLAFDQATKLMVHTGMELGETKVVIPYLFNIHYIRNPGGAFGLFGASSELVRFVLLLLLPLICFIVFWLLQKTQSKLAITSLGFILGGAFGNFMDRLKFGSVIDFLDWYVFWGEESSWHWPTFNIADLFFITGVFILLGFLFKYLKEFVRLPDKGQ